MKGLNRLAVFGIILYLFSCSSVKEGNNHWFRDINVCKKLQGKVLIYPVFIEQKKVSSWADSEMKDFMDSLKIAVDWIKFQADSQKVNLEFITEQHPKAISKGLPGETINETAKMFEAPAGFEKINKHYDGIAKMMGGGIPRKETVPPFVEKVTNKERFCARLRNAYQVESVVLLFVHKGEGNNNVYYVLNSVTNNDVEYGVTSIDQPSMIAGQILELFGAAPLLYLSDKKSEQKAAEYIKKNFPNDIMANPFKQLNGLNIGKYTQYLIGWHGDFLDEYKTFPSSRLIIIKK